MYNVLSEEIDLSPSTLAKFYQHQKAKYSIFTRPMIHCKAKCSLMYYFHNLRIGLEHQIPCFSQILPIFKIHPQIIFFFEPPNEHTFIKNHYLVISPKRKIMASEMKNLHVFLLSVLVDFCIMWKSIPI